MKRDTILDTNAPAPTPALYLAQAQQWVAVGNLAQAAESLREALALLPPEPELVRTHGKLLWQLGDLEAARRQYVKATVLAPGFARAHVELAAVQLALGQAEAAEASARRALLLEPANLDAFRLIGRACLITKRYPEALDAYQVVCQQSPEDAEALIAQGKCYLALGELSLAEAALVQVLTREPENGQAHDAMRHLKQAKLTAAIRLIQESEQCWQGQVETEARDKLMAAVRLAPFDDHVEEEFQRLATTYLYCRGRWDDCVNLLHERARQLKALRPTQQVGLFGVQVLGPNWLQVIGHLGCIDAYVKLTKLGLLPPLRTLIVGSAPRYPISNPHYLGYWHRYLPAVISDPETVKLLEPVTVCLEQELSALMLADGRLLSYSTAIGMAERLWDAEDRPPLLSLRPEDHDRGRACLEALGVPRDAWFVATHVRSGSQAERSGRNADIASYLPAFQAIVERGGWVIRMGTPSMPALPPMEHVIDYAHSPYCSDWMDVFLWAQCRFFIGTTSGPCQIPPTFGVPGVLTNWWPIGLRAWFRRDLLISKLCWDTRQQRYLTFEEVFSRPAAFSEAPDYLASQGLRLEPNTPDEIRQVTLEMLDRLDGTVQYTETDQTRHGQFEAIAGRADRSLEHPTQGISRLGRDFLRKHAALLESSWNGLSQAD